MKRLLYLILIIMGMTASCDVLDVEPNHSMPADAAFTDSVGVERGIIGCYSAMQSAGYYGRDYLVYGDLAADNLRFSGVTISYAEINNNNILADNGLIESTWASIYNVLNRINTLLAQIPSIDDSKLSDTGKNAYMAELMFLRALAHYDLMRLWGPVAIRVEPVTGDEASLNVKRNSVAEVFVAINTDLTYALQHMPEFTVSGRASMPAAQALQARVALHEYYITNQSTLLQTAVDQATAVIELGGFSLEPDYAILFSGAPTNEVIFEIEFNELDDNRLAQYFFYTNLSGRYEFAPTNDYLNLFDNADERLGASVAYFGANPYVFKYNDIETGTDNVKVFRLAEMYLLRAEAQALMQSNSVAILADINEVRERAGLQPFSSTSYTNMLTEIELQRQKEFAFEGHRWFDLVRTGRALDVLPNITDPDQTLFPIPLNEILSNDNEEMYQNDGY